MLIEYVLYNLGPGESFGLVLQRPVDFIRGLVAGFLAKDPGSGSLAVLPERNGGFECCGSIRAEPSSTVKFIVSLKTWASVRATIAPTTPEPEDLIAYPLKDSSSPKASPKESAYGFDIETERRREAGFLEEIRRRRWTVKAYDDEGNIVETCHAAELSAAVEIAKELEEEYPKVDIITEQGSVFPRREWRQASGKAGHA